MKKIYLFYISVLFLMLVYSCSQPKTPDSHVEPKVEHTNDASYYDLNNGRVLNGSNEYNNSASSVPQSSVGAHVTPHNIVADDDEDAYEEGHSLAEEDRAANVRSHEGDSYNEDYDEDYDVGYDE